MITHLNRLLVLDRNTLPINQATNINASYTATVDSKTNVTGSFSGSDILQITAGQTFNEIINTGTQTMPHTITVIANTNGMSVINLTLSENGVPNSVIPLAIVNISSVTSASVLNLTHNGQQIFNSINEVRSVLKENGFQFNKSTKLWERE